MRLLKDQKEAVIAWVAEGLETDEINKRAAKFKPRFKVSKTQVAFYRKSRSLPLQEIKQSGEFDALSTGLAVREKRVEVLQALADKLIGELLPTDPAVRSTLWTDNRKSVGMSAYDYLEFNKAEVDSLRGVLDDIASELGQRAPGVQVNNTYHFDMEKWKQETKKRLQDVAALED